jgi:hypothetical protein
MDSVVGISLDAARNVAVVVAVTALVLAVLSAWLMKAIISKLAGAVVLGVIALLAWTQRTSAPPTSATASPPTSPTPRRARSSAATSPSAQTAISRSLRRWSGPPRHG